MTVAYPLQWPTGWPRTIARKSTSRFNTTFDSARRQLVDELRMLGARDAVISSWLPLRIDGAPRADMARRRIDDPGVAVYFTLRGKNLVMARDEYWSVHDNLRSIGLAVEHLRGLHRHGGATMMDRAFAGFAALPAPGAQRHWSEVLGIGRHVTRAEINTAHRRLALTNHPDHGGDAAKMAEINEARDRGLRELAA